MRPCEPATVTHLHFVIANDGASVATLAVLTLTLSDPASPLHARKFEVEIPAPDAGHPDFVVLRARFEAAAQRGWQVGDRCEVSSDSNRVPAGVMVGNYCEVSIGAVGVWFTSVGGMHCTAWVSGWGPV